MRHLYLLFFILTLLFSCGRPLQVVRVQPADEGRIDRYRYGSAIQHAESDGVGVDASFYDASPEYLLFDVEIYNDSDGDILVDPADAALELPGGRVRQAIEPEYQLLGMDLESVRKARQSRTIAWATAAVLVAASAYALSVPSDGAGQALASDAGIAYDLTFQAVDVMNYVLVGNDDLLLRRNAVPADAALPPPDNRFFWLDYSFRKTTLRPGESAAGKLVFPRVDDDTELELIVPAGADHVFRFPFTQRVFRER